ncbi:hypothetical protein JR065_15525 [Xanthomonas sp. AmX2]|nr:hypothetical protein [Xanthomonas sp.]MBN6151756.1 hypothetical protein [Xanthomonas sp.]
MLANLPGWGQVRTLRGDAPSESWRLPDPAAGIGRCASAASIPVGA